MQGDIARAADFDLRFLGGRDINITMAADLDPRGAGGGIAEIGAARSGTGGMALRVDADPAGPEHPADATDRPAESDQHSAIDALFADQHFEEFEEVGVLKTIQALPVAEGTPPVRQPRAPLSTTQKVLMGVAGGLQAISS